MTHLIGEFRFYKGQNRIYPHTLTLSTLISAIAISAIGIQHGQVRLNIGDNASFECVQFRLRIKLPIVGPIQLALQGVEPNSTAVGLDPNPSWIGGGGQVHTGMARACLDAAHAVFVEYFEAFRPWLDKNVSRDFYIWPSPWNFARVVRNAKSCTILAEFTGTIPSQVAFPLVGMGSRTAMRRTGAISLVPI
jgi:hypothetical protein